MKSRCEGLGMGSMSCHPQDSESRGTELTHHHLTRSTQPELAHILPGLCKAGMGEGVPTDLTQLPPLHLGPLPHPMPTP